MVRYFCDGCNKQITEDNVCTGGNFSSSRLGAEIRKNGHTLRVELLTAMDGTSNAGHWCKHCVLDALYKLDDRKSAKR